MFDAVEFFLQNAAKVLGITRRELTNHHIGGASPRMRKSFKDFFCSPVIVLGFSMHCLKIFQKCCKGALEYKRDHANHRRMLWFGKPYSYPNFFLTSSPSWATKDFLGKWRKLFRTRTRPNDSGFFPVFDIPLHVISLNLDFSAPTGPVCLILVIYYDRFTIYHNPIFRLPEIVFRRVISEKKISFWTS